jgi:deoxyribodipyrimidine photolyase-related protein
MQNAKIKTMNKVGIIFPHQLFEQNALIGHVHTIYVVEEFLFFRQYLFHKQKIAFHRASMKFYADYLTTKNIKVVYIDSQDELSDIRRLIPHLKAVGFEQLHYKDVTDNWLEKRIQKSCHEHKIVPFSYNSPLFINTPEQITSYFAGKKKFFQTDFYKLQRKQLNILMDEQGKPVGDKWTYDDENRLKYPKGKVPPTITPLNINKYYEEALDYTAKNFEHHYGAINADFIYPSTFEESKV